MGVFRKTFGTEKIPRNLIQVMLAKGNRGQYLNLSIEPISLAAISPGFHYMKFKFGVIKSMFYKKIFSFAVLLFMISVSAKAQVISGKVVDARTKDSLPGANIVQEGTTNGVSTSNNGEFTLKLLKSGKKAIKISYVGYKTREIILSGRNQKGMTINLISKTIMSNAIQVEALRVNKRSAVTYTNLTRKQIKKENLGHEIPYLLRMTPSVVTTSDDGLGFGYTGIRIRGVPATRINVTINGIPLNDAEEQAVYWVDLPNLASSVQSMQIQRGVGTSTNGAGAFGASINIQTTGIVPDPYGDVSTSVGSYNSEKYNVKFGTGLLKNGWSFDGSLSKLHSDGYIDRAFSNLKSFFLTGSHYGKHSLLQANVFSGKERTYQAWYGVEQSILDTNRTYNPYTYPNQTDNYQQDHYQLLYSYKVHSNWILNAAAFFVKGRGYYEEYKKNQLFSDYKLNNVIIGQDTIRSTNLIRRKWLNNDFYGVTYSSDYKKGKQLSLKIGGLYDIYSGTHYGRVIWAQYFSNGQIRHTYYNNRATKKDFNIYTKLTYRLAPKLSGFGDMQLRKIAYNFLGNGTVKRNGKEVIVPMQQNAYLTFWNPKIGFNYQINKSQRYYLSFGVGNKEPDRNDYVESTPQSRPKPETLYDWETGYRYNTRHLFLGATGYFMDYHNQLVLTGQINDVGDYIQSNVKSSYRLGLELQAAFKITKFLQWSGNATISRNKIKLYHEYIDNYDTGGQTMKTFHNTDIAFSPGFIGSSDFHFKEGNLSADFMSKYIGKQYLDNTQNNNSIINAYFVNNLRLSYDLRSVPGFKDINISFLLNNIFNELYESNGYNYSYISGGKLTLQNYYYPQAGRNFLVRVKLGF